LVTPPAGEIGSGPEFRGFRGEDGPLTLSRSPPRGARANGCGDSCPFFACARVSRALVLWSVFAARGASGSRGTRSACRTAPGTS
jgi:hypothetical protein